MRIPLFLIVGAIVLVGGGLGTAALFVLRKLGMKEPDVMGQIQKGERCEACEQPGLQRTEDGRLACFSCGHVRDA